MVCSTVTTHTRRRIIRQSIFWARGGYWASVRAAVQPILHSDMLTLCSSVMQEASERVVKDIGRKSTGLPLDIRKVLNLAALDLILECVYGINLRRTVRCSTPVPTTGVRLVWGHTQAATSLSCTCTASAQQTSFVFCRD
jgi:Cytochrome P450